jgi:hypothetical protein
MPLSRWSTDLFSSAIALSKLSLDAEPVVTPSPAFSRPEDCAVPALLVPGGGDATCGDVGLADEGLLLPIPLPVPWATVTVGASRIAIVADATVTDNLRMAILPCGHQRVRKTPVPTGAGAIQFGSNAICAS